MALYTKRVSFNSLTPNIDVDVDDPLHIPPQYCKKQANPGVNSTTRTGLDLNLGYAPAKREANVFDVFDSINNISHSAANTYTAKKIMAPPKLPPAPSKSILKAYDPSEIAETIAVTSANESKLGYPKKKSIVEMTAEELLAMDQQYRTGVDLESFKFDTGGYLPFHNLGSIDSKRPGGGKFMKQNASQIDKLVGNIVDLNNKKLLRPSNTNFNSFSTSFRHKDMTNFIRNEYRDHNDSNPYNLRDLLVYINGKSYSWDSINWVLKNYVQDGDHLILISNIPDDEKLDVEIVEQKSRELSLYVLKALELLEKGELKISITVDLIKGDDVKSSIKSSVNLYSPNFFFISTLATTRMNNKVADYVRLSFYAVRHLTVPVVIIPSSLIDESKTSLKVTDDTGTEVIDNEEYFTGLVDNACSEISSKDDSDLSPSRAHSPQRFYPSIKFSNNLEVPRTGTSSGSTSPYGTSRRNSSSAPIYKVKSLLDSTPMPEIQNKISRTKSASLTTTKSNASKDEKRKSSNFRRVQSTPAESDVTTAEKKKKRSFFSKLGFKK